VRRHLPLRGVSSKSVKLPLRGVSSKVVEYEAAAEEACGPEKGFEGCVREKVANDPQAHPSQTRKRTRPKWTRRKLPSVHKADPSKVEKGDLNGWTSALHSSHVNNEGMSGHRSGSVSSKSVELPLRGVKSKVVKYEAAAEAACERRLPTIHKRTRPKLASAPVPS
jgi:hypothetical protein